MTLNQVQQVVKTQEPLTAEVGGGVFALEANVTPMLPKPLEWNIGFQQRPQFLQHLLVIFVFGVETRLLFRVKEAKSSHRWLGRIDRLCFRTLRPYKCAKCQCKSPPLQQNAPKFIVRASRPRRSCELNQRLRLLPPVLQDLVLHPSVCNVTCRATDWGSPF